MTTDFSDVCTILGKLFYQYKGEGDFVDFIEYNDIGLPLAYLSSENLCEPSPDGEKYILETWELFLAALGVEDKGFSSLEELLEIAEQKGKEK